MLEASLSAAVSTASGLAVDQGFGVSTIRTRDEQQAPGHLLGRFRFQGNVDYWGRLVNCWRRPSLGRDIDKTARSRHSAIRCAGRRRQHIVSDVSLTAPNPWSSAVADVAASRRSQKHVKMVLHHHQHHEGAVERIPRFCSWPKGAAAPPLLLQRRHLPFSRLGMALRACVINPRDSRCR